MRLVGEAASQGQAAPAGEVFGTVGGEQRLDSDDAGEGLRWEADDREKPAVKLAEAGIRVGGSRVVGWIFKVTKWPVSS